MKIPIALIMIIFSLNALSQEPVHGELTAVNGDTYKIWSKNSNKWLDIESFWIEYANTKGGLTWGKSTRYPEYSKVKENETLIIQLEEGSCLMEFFHKRWRRANDVRRWNEKLNSIAGCPNVFD